MTNTTTLIYYLFPGSISRAEQMAHRAHWRCTLWRARVRAEELTKRALDIGAAATALALLTPLFALVAFAIRLEDHGPIFYTQTRVGRNGHRFRFFKFRSMFVDADRRKEELLTDNESGDGVIFKMKKDPRVTRTGRILRRFSIDEMPQFYNVLRGDLALVGPRPPLPKEVAEYSMEELKRLHCTQGLTCLWQVTGRSDIPFSQQVELDLDYIRSKSTATDISLLARTIPAVISGKGAY
jgi:lipopolysaccharide/colanic/teichoic acid biosynthesis glycosyltransferase